MNSIYICIQKLQVEVCNELKTPLDINDSTQKSETNSNEKANELSALLSMSN